MKRCLIACLALALLASSTPTLHAEANAAAADEVVSRYKINQQRARELTRELLNALVNAHIQQLKDNGLTDLPLYTDLIAMQANMDELVREMMPQVIDILNAVDTAAPAERQGKVKEAQGLMRKILLRLLAERERLRLRRQQAELIERLSEVITKQKETRASTLDLGAGDEQAVLGAIGAQQGVSTLYADFTKMLAQVSTWPGDLGAVAGESARVLKEAKVTEALDGAYNNLMQTKFMRAADDQKTAIEGLERVLVEIRKLEDPSWVDSDAAKAVRELLKEQEALRDKVKEAGLDDAKGDDALDAQSNIQQKLERLESALGSNPQASDLLRRAVSESSEARESIFNEDVAKTTDQQGKVIGALAQLSNVLDEQAAGLDGALSAEEYNKLADTLGATKAELQKAQAEHKKAEAQADANASQAAKTEQGVSEQLGDTAETDDLPSTVASRIKNAEDAAAVAADALKDDAADSDAALDDADRAIAQAIGATAEAEADAKRKALATKLGELNRATESLERAAAAARDTADDLQTGQAPDDDTKTAAADDLGKVADIAQNVQEGVKDLSPEAASALDGAADQANQAKDAAAQADNAQQAQAAGDSADQVAQKLDAAADAARKEMVKTAQQLIDEVGGQLDDLAGLQKQLDQAAQAGDAPSPDALQQLADAALQQAPAVGDALQNAADAAQQAQAQAGQPQNAQAQPQAGQPQNAQAQPQAGQPQNAQAQPQAGQPQNAQAQPQAGQPQNAQAQPQAGQPQNAQAQPQAGQPQNAQAQPQAGQAGEAQAQVDRELQRARVLAEIKQDNLQEQLALAQRLAALAQQAEASAGQIADARDALDGQLADAGQPAAGQPSAGEPSAGQPAAGQPAAGEPSAGQPSAGEPSAGQPSAGQPSAGQPSAGQPSAGQPSAGQPSAGQPSAGQPSAGQPSAGQPAGGQPSQEAQQLAQAIAQQAGALAGLGQAAAQASGQAALANEPIAEAVQIASTLAPQAAAPGSPAAGSPSAGQPAAGQSAAGQPSAGQPSAGQPSAGSPSAGSPSAGSPSAGSPSAGSPSAGSPSAGSPSAGSPSAGSPSAAAPSAGAPGAPMGQGLVPASPLATAAMMAGVPVSSLSGLPMVGGAPMAGLPMAGMPGAPGSPSAGMSMAAGMTPGMGMAPGMTPGMMPGLGQGMPSPMPTPGGPGGAGGGTSMGKMSDAENMGVQAGPASKVEAQTDGDSRTPGARNGDTKVDRRARAKQAWFASLPRGVRDAIKSSQKRTAPRGYEDRLKKYFEGVR